MIEEFAVLILIITEVSFSAEFCKVNLPNVYGRSSSNVHLMFSAVLPIGVSEQIEIQKRVTETEGKPLLRITFPDENEKIELVSGVTFIGQVSTGNISLTILDVSTQDAGLYRLKRTMADDFQQCLTLYILGKPTKPLLIEGGNPEIGGYVTYSCSSNSTTVPANHSLKMKYEWTYAAQKDPAATRFTYGPLKQTMTISDFEKTDQNTSLSCTATEHIMSGITSDSSQQIRINVEWGPENIRFQPPETTYSVESGKIMKDVTCTADCNPSCSYYWTKGNSRYDVQTLSLGPLNSSKAGTYNCMVKRGSSEDYKKLRVDVIYGPSSVTLSPDFLSYRKNENTVLQNITCTSQCWPTCTQLWTGPNNVLSYDVLVLGALNRLEAGTYQCTSENNISKSNVTEEVVVQVIYGPDEVFLDIGNTIVNEGDSVSSKYCTAECFPACSYSWSLPAESQAHFINGSLLFEAKSSRQDAGAYTCFAINPEKEGTKSGSFTLHVRYGPDEVSINPGNDTVNEGDAMSRRTCYADCFPNCTYSWTIPIESQARFTHGHLIFENKVSRSDAGTYICNASNPERKGSRRASFTLNVRYGPEEILLRPGSEFVTEGEQTRQRNCYAECFPACIYEWDIPAQSQASFSNGVLMFGEHILRNDAGTYTCTARNQERNGNQTDYFSLHVRYFPDLDVFMDKESNVLDEDDENVTLLCKATGQPEDYTYFGWIHMAPDNTTIIQTYVGNISGHQNRLILQGLSYMDSGIYRCNVSNNVTDFRTGNLYATKDIKLTKKGEPQVVTKNSEVFVAIDSDVELNVPFYSNDDTIPVVSWYKADNDSGFQITNTSTKYSFAILPTSVTVLFYAVKLTVDGYTAQLKVSGIKPLDLGAYQILINNSVGHSSTMLYVSPAGPPKEPKYFSVMTDSATDSSITLTWYSGFHGGGNQTFYIDFRKKGSTKWLLGLFVFGGQEEEKQFSAEIHNLSADTAYEFQIYSENIFNRSDPVKTEGNTTSIKQVKPPPVPIGAAIGASLGAAAAILTLVIVVLLWKKRNSKRKEDGSKKTFLTSNRHSDAKGHDDIAEINLNPMYESSNAVQLPLNNAYMYAKVEKQSYLSNPGTSSDVYSVVNKAKGKDKNSKPKDSSTSDVYAAPLKKGKGKDKKSTKADGKKKLKTSKHDDGILYENAETSTNKFRGADNVYENPVCSSSDEKPSRTKNDDGLIYIEVELPRQKDAQNKQPVVHGEDRTVYADVAFGQVGEPIPDSDEEKK